MLLVSCVCRRIVFMLCLRGHICFHEFCLVCVHVYVFYMLLRVCVCVRVYGSCDCVSGVSVFKCVCVVPLLVSGAEPLLTVISLFMQCEKGLAGA